MGKKSKNFNMKNLSLNSPDQSVKLMHSDSTAALLAQYLADSTASVFTNKINGFTSDAKNALDSLGSPRVVYVVAESLLRELDRCGTLGFNEDRVAACVASVTALVFAYRELGESEARLKKALNDLTGAAVALCAFDKLMKDQGPKV
tara:strand:- start:1678 stop:2118 length:441 start_codon:yes stop_codon:yes gene_type:complete